MARPFSDRVEEETKHVSSGADVCFIIGSPRSGTTILCDVLGRHPEIERLSEPYFLWDWYHGGGQDDIRTAADVTPHDVRFLRREFHIILGKSGKRILVEKTPENCFRIPFMHSVFPDAKWVHIVRDGRDVVVSMRTEWRQREAMVQNRSVIDFARTAGRMLWRQRYWRNRLQALRYELGQNASLNPRRYFNKAKWQGRAAWGPRFPGWAAALDDAKDIVEFNAQQWKACVDHAGAGLANVDTSRLLSVRYEDLTDNPNAVLGRIFEFLGVSDAPGLGADLGKASVGKWQNALSDEEKRLVNAQIDDRLVALGYKSAGAREEPRQTASKRA